MRGKKIIKSNEKGNFPQKGVYRLYIHLIKDRNNNNIAHINKI